MTRAHPRPVVVLAEDDSAMRTMLALGLRHRGFDILEVRDGHELLARAAGAGAGAGRPDALVVDVRMRGPSGLEVLRALCERGEPFAAVLITAFGDEATHADGARLGVRVLDKPFDMEELAAAIREALGGRAA